MKILVKLVFLIFFLITITVDLWTTIDICVNVTKSSDSKHEMAELDIRLV